MLIAIAIQLFIASFSSALLTGLLAYYDPDAINLSAQIRPRVGIIGDMQSPLVTFLEDRSARLTVFATPEDAEQAFFAGQIDAAIWIPGKDASTADLKLYLPDSETQASVILMLLREPLKRYENTVRVQQGLRVYYTDVEGEPATAYEFRYAVILTLLMFFPAFVTGNLVVDAISEEFVNRTLDTLWTAPLSLNTILGAKMTAAVLLSGIQCILWVILLRLNGIVIYNWGLVLLLASLSAALIAACAALITLVFKDRERSQFIYAVFILLTTGLSYFSNASPIALTTRLAIGDVYTGFLHIIPYVLLLLILLAILFSTSRKWIER
ncbi:MAG: ABC transporter permease [Anaerolineae bacterium]|nr:ABC transporter permease [Anaerolineae bacterium]